MDPMIPVLAQLQRPDYFVLVGYFILMLGIGAYFYRHMQGMKDYFTGGNRIPWWLSGVSFYMSSFSVFSFVYYSSLAFRYGWVAVTLYWVTVPATIVSAVFFAARWRRARIDSPVEYLETRYNAVLRQVCAWHGIPVRIVDSGLKLIAIGTFLSAGLGLPEVETLNILGLEVSLADLGLHEPLRYTMLATGSIMLLYTLMGGLWTVTVTDFVQFVVMVVAIVALLPLSIIEAGGIEKMQSGSPEGFFSLTHPNYSWVYVSANLLMFTLAFSSINWSLIQRYYCVPTEKDARKAGWLVVGLNILGPPAMFIPAMAARQFLTGIADKDVYPELCKHLLPAGMLGLVIAAMFAATMSMLSSDYNVCASVLTNDLYRRFMRPRASGRQLVLVGRLMTLLVGVIAMGVAFGMAGGSGEDQFRNMVTLFSVATAPVALPMLLGLLWRRITATGAFCGFLVGVTLGLVLFFAWSHHELPFDVSAQPQWQQHASSGRLVPAVRQELANHGVSVSEAAVVSTSEQSGQWTIDDGGRTYRVRVVEGTSDIFLEHVQFLGAGWKKENVILFATSALTLLVIVGVSLADPKRVREQERATVFLRRLDVPIGQAEEDEMPAGPSTKAPISPFRVVGLATVLIAGLMFAILPAVYAAGGVAFWVDLLIALALVGIGAIMIWQGRRTDRRSEEML